MISITACTFMAIVLAISGTFSSCMNVSDANLLYSRLLKDYNKHLLPLQNQSEAVEVSLKIYLTNINSFDELSGELAFTALFNFTWREERMSWLADDFDTKTSLFFAPEDVWRPRLFVRESVNSLQEIGNISDMLRIAYDGFVIWTVGAIVKVVCSVDVTFFPFDSQTCGVTITTVSVRSEEMKIKTLSSSAESINLTSNSQWDYIDSNIVNFSIPNGQTGVILYITLKRRSEFYVIYLIIPLVFLGKINNLVFAIPASAGERNSVAITSFLSFAVYMQIVNSSVPQSSAPIAYIYYYLLFLLIYSSYIMFACIVSLRIYDKQEEVPRYVQNIVLGLRFRCCKQRQNRPVRLNSVNQSDSQTGHSKTEQDNADVKTNDEDKIDDTKVTWKLVGKTFDIYCCVLNFIIFIAFTWVSFIKLYLNEGV